MDFARRSVKLVRSKQRLPARIARLAKAMRELVWLARRLVALVTQPIRLALDLRAKQPAGLRQLSEKPQALASRAARGQLVLAVRQLDQPVPVFDWRAGQPSVPSHD
jgi:hypothetical protein